MRRMKGVTPRPRNLFVTPSDKTRPLSKNALSYLLQDTILEAHRSLPTDLLPLKVRAHDIRGVATSLNLWRDTSVMAMLHAASWKTPSVFAKHYLWDVGRTDGDTFSLGAIVASGDIMD